jgi:OmpR family response regulator RpaB
VTFYTGNILIIDSEIVTRQTLAKHLIDLNYKVFLSTNRVSAFKILNKENIDLIIIDILLPKVDGYKICRQIRKSFETPIIILTALDSLESRIMGLESGADDFVAKPFSLKEIEVRINSNLRRYDFQKLKILPTRQELLNFGDLKINFTTQKVLKNNKQLLLTDIEFNLLQLMVQNAGCKLSRAMILANVWGYTPERDIDTRIVDVHIHRLRAKLEKNP